MLHKTDEARIAWSVLEVQARIDKSCEIFDTTGSGFIYFFLLEDVRVFTHMSYWCHLLMGS